MTKKKAQLVRKPAYLIVHPSLIQMRGHRIPGERSNNRVGSGGLDHSGAKNGENGERNNQRGVAGDKKLKTCPCTRTLGVGVDTTGDSQWICHAALVLSSLERSG